MSSRQSADIGALLDRYLLSLDADSLDDAWARSLFTENARVVFPVSQHEGLDGLAAFHQQSLAKFAATQHLGSPAVIEVTGNRASFRANLISTHVHLPGNTPPAEQPALFTAGTFVEGEARRTPDGWRLSQLSFRLVWSTGSPPRSAG
jgi:hypothetical protein